MTSFVKMPQTDLMECAPSLHAWLTFCGKRLPGLGLTCPVCRGEVGQDLFDWGVISNSIFIFKQKSWSIIQITF